MLDRYLDPPEPSKDAQWVNNRVEVMEEEVIDTLALLEFDTVQGLDITDHIDWDKLRRRLRQLAEAELEEDKYERAIEQWEDRQRWNDV